MTSARSSKGEQETGTRDTQTPEIRFFIIFGVCPAFWRERGRQARRSRGLTSQAPKISQLGFAELALPQRTISVTFYLSLPHSHSSLAAASSEQTPIKPLIINTFSTLLRRRRSQGLGWEGLQTTKNTLLILNRGGRGKTSALEMVFPASPPKDT